MALSHLHIYLAVPKSSDVYKNYKDTIKKLSGQLTSMILNSDVVVFDNGTEAEFKRATILNIPIVKPSWISRCSQQKTQEPMENYILSQFPASNDELSTQFSVSSPFQADSLDETERQATQTPSPLNSNPKKRTFSETENFFENSPACESLNIIDSEEALKMLPESINLMDPPFSPDMGFFQSGSLKSSQVILNDSPNLMDPLNCSENLMDDEVILPPKPILLVNHFPEPIQSPRERKRKKVTFKDLGEPVEPRTRRVSDAFPSIFKQEAFEETKGTPINIDDIDETVTIDKEDVLTMEQMGMRKRDMLRLIKLIDQQLEIEKISPNESKFKQLSTLPSNCLNRTEFLRKMTFCYSCCSELQIQSIYEFVKKFGGRLEPDFNDEKTTILIVGNESRTAKVLKALAKGCYIIKIDWIRKSLKYNVCLDLQPFEAVDWFIGARRLRRASQKKKTKIFKGLTFFISSGTTMKESDLESIICTAGGRLKPLEKCMYCISGGKSKKETLKELKEKGKKLDCIFITMDWVLDVLSSGKLRPTDEYLLK